LWVIQLTEKHWLFLLSGTQRKGSFICQLLHAAAGIIQSSLMA